MQNSHDFFRISLIRLAFVFLACETIFRLLSNLPLFNRDYFTAELFLLSAALFLSWFASLFPVRFGKFLIELISWFFACYTITQLQFMNFYGSYMSVKATFDGAGRISQFAGQFIALIKPSYWTELLPPLLSTLLFRNAVLKESDRLLTTRKALIPFLILETAGTLLVANAGYLKLYTNPQFFNRAIREFGIGRFFILDVLTIGSQESSSSLIIEETPIPSPSSAPSAKPADTPASEPVITRRDVIDDSAWTQLMEAEKDDDIKSIDQYLMNRTITDFNDHTGMMKDFNVVYIMIEAFDYMGIDRELTPTLYKMKEEGWDFTHHYTPKFSCATGESEFVSEISLMPQTDLCTPNQYAENQWTESIFSIFNHAGYYTSAYHNWKDEFYERRTLYSHSGCQAYLNFDDIQYNQLWGWQSDLEMMELTMPYWIDKDQFVTLYVTSSTHFPYDQGSDLGNRYLDEIDRVHPDYPIEVKRYISKSMELDKAMAYLIEHLEEAGKLDNTLIVLFADHHPLETAIKTLDDYGGYEVDRLDGLNEDRTPMIFYSGSIKGEKLDEVNSTFDILPTVANLTGLEYDPRLYVGTDYFSDTPKTVIFPNGTWIMGENTYYSSDDTFEGTLSPEEVEHKNNEVTNLFSISRLIYKYDYFGKRDTIAFPKYR